MLSSEGSRFFPGFPIPIVSFKNLWRHFQVHQLQSVSPSSSYFTVFFKQCCHLKVLDSSSDFQYIQFLFKQRGLLIAQKLLFLSQSHYYYYYTPREIFPPALALGLLVLSKWQQVSSGLRNSFQYSGWSQLWQSFYNLNFPRCSCLFWGQSKCANLCSSAYFTFLARSNYLFIFSFSFHSVVFWNGNVHKTVSSPFLVNSLQVWSSGRD